MLRFGNGYQNKMFFHQFGGFGGGVPRGAPVSENTSLYAALEIEKGATDADVKKAYRHLAMKHHPDKGGDPEKFKEISKAYETLSDPVARKRYDLGGGEQSAVPDPGDIFSSLFGTKSRKRTDDVVQDLRVTLEEIYAGCTKKISIRRKIINRQDGAVKTCAACSGKGVRVEVLRMGAMLQQIQTQCVSCGGLGKTCGYLDVQTDVEIYVPRGASEGHKIYCRGLTDEILDSDPGDVVLIVRQIPHASFVRRNIDLYITRQLSLIEALGGFEIGVSHLDGRRMLVKSPSGDVVHLTEKVDLSSPTVTWETLEGCDCASATVAEAATEDVEILRRACEKELNQRGIHCEAFVVADGKAYFKGGTADEAKASKTACPKKSLHVRTRGRPCMKYAVEGEGMPLVSNPSLKGNLFLELELVLPASIEGDALEKLRQLLPAPLEGKGSEEAEECEAVLLDCVKSYEAYSNLKSTEDDPPPHRSEARGPGCHQQ
jgi:DnaJ family protein A protein 2